MSTPRPTPPHLALAAFRYPPEGAFDFALTALLRRHLALVSGLVLPAAAVRPAEAHEGGRPHAALFAEGRCTHVALASAWTTTGQDLVVRVDLFHAQGPVATLQQQGALDDPGPVALQLARDLMARLGVRASAGEARCLQAPAIARGPAFTHFIRYWQGVYGAPGIDWEGELRRSAEAGYPGAWRYVAGWTEHAAEIEGFQPDAEAVLPILSAAVQGDPCLLAAVGEQASLLRAAGRAGEALALLDQAGQWAPHGVVLWLERAAALDSVGRRDEALAAADRAWELSPWDERAVRTRWWALLHRGQGDEALAVLEQAARLAPGNLYLRFLHGTALCEARRWREAQAVLEPLCREIPGHPWHDLPFKVPHLDHHDSTRWALSYPLALATAGAGGDPREAIALNIRLNPDPEAWRRAVGGVEGMVTALKTRTMFEDPRMRQAEAAGPDGGVRTLEDYVQLACEVQRGTAAGAALETVLAHWGSDPARWLKAQSYWSDLLSRDLTTAVRFSEVRARYEAGAGPMPAYPRPAPAAAPVAASGGGDDGGVHTLEDWARVSGGLQRALSQGQDFMAALAALGLDLARYQQASAFWSAKMAADPDLGLQLVQAMSRYL